MDSSRIAEWLRSFVPTRRRLVVGILVALALTPALLFVQRSLHASAFLLEEQLHDWHQKFTVLRPPDSHPLVALIVVDDELVGRSQGAAEVDRVVLARIVRTVDALGARVLGIDMTFLTPSTAAADEALVNALRQARSATVMGFADERSRVDGQEAEFQSTLLARVARPVGFTHIRVDRDGVVRFWASPADNASVPLSFPAQLMRAVGTERREPPYPRIDWLGNTLDGGAPFAVIPASHLREALGQDVRRLSAAVKDRIVLIGLSTKETRRIRTPLTGADR
ncbi:MAG: CHASE2 domain-containing protein, partial [Hyphomicrobiaceae bacterium]|nr:CHASE2 domain-containing protein [Hyphomicrobiaceae bacterium]